MRLVVTVPLMALLLVVAVSTAVSAQRTRAGADANGRFVYSGDTAIRTLGNSGWVEFCNNGAAPSNSSSTPGDRCISIRVDRIAMVDSNGSVIGAPPLRINSVPSATTIGTPGTAALALCVSDTSDNCGANVNGTALSAVRIPIRVSLAGVGSTGGELILDALIFTERGYFRFHGRNYSVGTSTMKFDMSATGVTWPSGASNMTVDVVTKNKGRPQGRASIGRNASGFVSVDDGAIVNLPQYYTKTSALASEVWHNASLRTVTQGANTIVQYSFAGPFNIMSYDPIVGAEGSSGGGSATGAATSASALSTAVIAIAAFAALSVLIL